MPSNLDIPKKIVNLFLKHKGKCYYCGVLTKLPKSQKYTRKGTKVNPRMATVEHVYSRMDIRRLITDKSVLACVSCNNAKAYRDYDLVFNNGTYQDKEYEYVNSISNGLLINLYNGIFNQLAI